MSLNGHAVFSYEKKISHGFLSSVFLDEKTFMGDFIGPTSVNISCLLMGQNTSNVNRKC